MPTAGQVTVAFRRDHRQVQEPLELSQAPDQSLAIAVHALSLPSWARGQLQQAANGAESGQIFTLSPGSEQDP